MVYLERTIIKEGLEMYYILHDNICELCAHNRNRYIACNGQCKGLTGKCTRMDKTISECYKFKKFV